MTSQATIQLVFERSQRLTAFFAFTAILQPSTRPVFKHGPANKAPVRVRSSGKTDAPTRDDGNKKNAPRRCVPATKNARKQKSPASSAGAQKAVIVSCMNRQVPTLSTEVDYEVFSACRAPADSKFTVVHISTVALLEARTGTRIKASKQADEV